MKTSGIKVKVKCEDCGKERYIEYYSLAGRVNSQFLKTGETLCSKCANSRMSGKNSPAYKHGNILLKRINMKFRCKNTGKIIEVKSTPLFSCVINSNLVSAQNRLRHYWTNIKTKKVGLFEELYTDIPQPKDKGILLKDILESEVDEKYYLSDKMLARIDRRKWSKPQIDPDKTGCIGTTNNSGRFGIDNGTTLIKVDKELNKKPDQNKAGCLTGGGHSGGNHSDMDLICVAMRGRETNCLTPKRTEYGKQIRKDYESEQRKNIQQREDFKTNALTSSTKR